MCLIRTAGYIVPRLSGFQATPKHERLVNDNASSDSGYCFSGMVFPEVFLSVMVISVFKETISTLLPAIVVLPLLFKATGQCGLDMPMVPTDIKLDTIQGYFVALYQDGWYLIPSLKLINMAQISIIIFSIALILGLILLILRLKGKK